MNATEKGDRALKNAIVISGENMKGVHDAQFVIAGGKAYVVYEANDIRANENPFWDFIYCAMSVVDLKTRSVERIYKISYSEQKFENMTLEKGCTFVPRIIKLNDETLRVFFTSESPNSRPSHCYYMDFDVKKGEFSNKINLFYLKTKDGIGEFNNKTLLDAALSSGIPARDVSAPFLNCCTFIFDIFYSDDMPMAIVNAFWTGINALAKWADDFSYLEIIGFIGEHSDRFKTTESNAVKTPSGEWLAILREETKFNYVFSESPDGVNWSKVHYSPLITNGASSKPILRKLGDRYYLGYNYSNDRNPTVMRNNFRLLRSDDCESWEEYYDFRSATTFQYPTFELCGDTIYFVASQGDKEQIIFGNLE